MFKKKFININSARSNSKTIKNKNLIKIFNRPLIYYTVKFLKQIKIKEKVIFCSTDSIKIKKLVESYGLKTPFLRPKKYSRDLSRDIEFVNHAINEFSKKSYFF